MNQVVIHDLNDIMNATTLFETNISVYLEGKSYVTMTFCFFFFFFFFWVLGSFKKKKSVKRKLFLVNGKYSENLIKNITYFLEIIFY